MAFSLVNENKPHDFDEIARSLVELWGANRQQCLEARRQTGVLLNALLGSPTEWQGHRQLVLRKVSAMLKITELELNRMRQFALSQDETSC
jgi:hypothetical protein